MSDATTYASKLAGQRVLITGGTSGIGLAVAEGAAEGGMHVTVASSSAAKVAAAVAHLQGRYPSAAGRIRGEVVDLGTPATLEANVVALLAAVGDVDHVVHTAGAPLTGLALADATVEGLQNSPCTRQWAVIMLAKHCAKALAAKGPRSSFTITTGAVGERPIAGWVVGSFFSSGMHGLARALALEMAPARANAVSPGAVITPLWDNLPEDRREALYQSVAGMTTVARAGKPEEVAEAYLYLMKDHFATGTVIRTDGGSLVK